MACSSTLLNLFALPALYLVTGRSKHDTPQASAPEDSETAGAPV